jgi:superfamily II DNA or RNA helicase
VSVTTGTATFEVGTLVSARGREWVVLPQSKAPDFLVLRPLGGGDDEVAGVFPKLEDVRPATFQAPDPADAGPASSAGLLRTALRIGFRASAGPFRSLARLAVEPRAYQLVPLLLALRQDAGPHSSVRMLICDDVGIGKTVEAGLIAAELLEQGDASGLAVLCGPALAEQWQRELAEKFGIQAELVLPSTIKKLEKSLVAGEGLFSRYPNVVVSTDFIKRPGVREAFWHGCPDLLIVDEAHTCVSDGTAGQSRMLRHKLVAELAKDESRHLILVTATPHSGKDDAFRNLLALLEPSLQHVDLETVAGRELLARYFVQRRRVDIRRYLDESTPFPEDRETKEQEYRLSAPYKELFDDVLAYARETVRDPEGGQLRQRVRYWSALALLRALASSPAAAAATLTTRADNVDARDAAEAERLGRSAVMDLPDEETFESADAAPGADISADAGDGDGDTPHRRRLKRFAARARAIKVADDRKLLLLEQTVQELLLDGFNPVIFCRFIDTAEYVAGHLTKKLGDTYAIDSVTGTLPPDERMSRIEKLGNDGKRPVLVATDCLSEGVNLQAKFQAVVHYDLAWNPTRHEQREGRVDRFNQAARKVRAVTIYGADNGIDGIVLNVLLRKHEQIRKALGISVPVPDRSDDVMEAILEGLLLRDAASEQLTLDFGHEHRDGLHSEWESAAEKEREFFTKYRQAGIHPEEVARELAEMRASLGTSSDVRGFTEEALRALRADVTSLPDGFKATTGVLPAGLADALVPGRPEPLPFHAELPVKDRGAYLDRTDPNVAAIARYVLESALDSLTPADPRDRPARRCGVMVTGAVPARTTLLLVRYRFHLELPGRDGPRQLVAEDAQLLAYRGRPASAQWLSADEVSALLAAVPSGNIPPDEALDFTERAVAALDALRPHLDEVADDLAVRLRDDHIRVREAGGQRVRRQIAVRAQKPADILGVYVYLPGNPASPAQGSPAPGGGA